MIVIDNIEKTINMYIFHFRTIKLSQNYKDGKE